MDARTFYAGKYLKGEGIEFGALHNPLPVNRDQCRVHYVDRHAPHAALQLFPELKPVAGSLVRPEFILDLDRDDFHALRDRRYDFFIANHVIEHLVNPLRFLERLNAVMAEGSLLYLAVPDKRYTFNVNRAVTSSEHLWQDYVRNAQELSVDHLNDFLLGITKDHIEPQRRAVMYFKGDRLSWNWFTRRRLYRLHRRRSVHVHVWDRPAFDEFWHWPCSACRCSSASSISAASPTQGPRKCSTSCKKEPDIIPVCPRVRSRLRPASCHGRVGHRQRSAISSSANGS